MKKEATSYRLSVDAKQKIKEASEHLGLNETSVIELAVRELQFNIRDLPERSAQQIQDLADWSGYTKTQIVLIAVENLWKEVKKQRESKMSNQNRPCVIAVGFPSFQEMKEGQEFLKEIFSYVHGELKGKNAPESICAGPKNGLSYDEAFVIVNRKFPESGWVYTDSVGWTEHDPQPRFVGKSEQ